MFHFLGEALEGIRAEDSDGSGRDRGGCDVVLPRYIYFPPRTRFDPEFWTGKRDRSPPLVCR